MPDPVGDLFLNGIASDISRQGYTNGVQGDASYVLTPAHTLRMGFTVSAEQTWVDNTSLGRGGRRLRWRTAFCHHRRRRQARLARRRLCAGRVENHRQADDELRRALRSAVALYRCQPAQPARKLHLQAVRVHDVPRRLCALFHAAGSGRGGAGQYRAVQRHDRPAGERRHQSGAAGAVALFRCRRRSNPAAQVLLGLGERLPHARARARRLLQDRNRPDRQRHFRPGSGAQRLQLRPWRRPRHRVQRQIP